MSLDYKDFPSGDITMTLPAHYTLERKVKLLAAHYDNITLSGHGLFFDFSNTPELKEPVLNRLIENFNWHLEKPFFIRKPE